MKHSKYNSNPKTHTHTRKYEFKKYHETEGFSDGDLHQDMQIIK